MLEGHESCRVLFLKPYGLENFRDTTNMTMRLAFLHSEHCLLWIEAFLIWHYVINQKELQEWDVILVCVHVLPSFSEEALNCLCVSHIKTLRHQHFFHCEFAIHHSAETFRTEVRISASSRTLTHSISYIPITSQLDWFRSEISGKRDKHALCPPSSAECQASHWWSRPAGRLHTTCSTTRSHSHQQPGKSLPICHHQDICLDLPFLPWQYDILCLSWQ